MDNLGRAFTFMFEDNGWPGKLLMGGLFVLLSFFLIGIPFLLGYLLEVARRSHDNNEVPLPEWDNMTEKLTQGLIFLIILIVYCIPALFFSTLPCLGPLLNLVYVIGFALALPHIMVNFALTSDLKQAFDFKRISDSVRDNLGDVVVVVLIAIGMQIVGSFGIILLVIGWLFTGFWAMLGKAYLFGKLYQKIGDAVVVETVASDNSAGSAE